MARLTGPEIRRQVELGNIQITPYDPERVQAASVDLTLGTRVLMYRGCVYEHAGPPDAEPIAMMPLIAYEPAPILDCHQDNETVGIHMKDGQGLVLYPGVLYLMHTVERLHTLKYETDVTGKSSLGRLGIIVHHTAGHIDPGFDGNVTLEVAAVHPVRVYAGMPFCQARYQTLEGEVEDYRTKGNYTGDAALGVQASRSWRQK